MNRDMAVIFTEGSYLGCGGGGEQQVLHDDGFAGAGVYGGGGRGRHGVHLDGCRGGHVGGAQGTRSVRWDSIPLRKT